MIYLYWIYIFFIGAALGSFINVLSARLPLGQSLWGHSHCDHCHKRLGAGELIPVFSFLLLKGRCLKCRKSIPVSYFLVELFTGLVFLAFTYHLGGEFNVSYVLLLLTLCLVIALSLSDFLYQIIPDELLVLILALGVINNYQNLVYYLGGAVMVAFIFWVIHHFSNGKAMGFADIKYVFVMGFWLSLPSLLLALYLAFVLGGVVSLVLVALKIRTMKSVIAFGPFLSVGFIVALWFVK